MSNVWNRFDYIEMFYNPKRRHGYHNRKQAVNQFAILFDERFTTGLN